MIVSAVQCVPWCLCTELSIGHGHGPRTPSVMTRAIQPSFMLAGFSEKIMSSSPGSARLRSFSEGETPVACGIINGGPKKSLQVVQGFHNRAPYIYTAA